MLYKATNRKFTYCSVCEYDEENKAYLSTWDGWDFVSPTIKQEVKSGDYVYFLRQIDNNNFIMLHLESMKAVMVHALYLEKI